MPVILVIIIVTAWIVILGPNLMKRRSRAAGGINSISHFHRALRLPPHFAPQPPAPQPARHPPAPAPTAPAPPGRGSVGGTGGPTRTPGYPEVSAVPVLSVVGADK